LKISILVPVYGSEQILEDSHREFSRAIKRVTDDYEIIFMVDGSPDNSEKLLKGIAEKDDHVRVFSHKPNRGLGYTLRRLFEEATGEYVIYFDADSHLCFDLAHLAPVVEKAQDADATIVSRYMLNPILPFHRWLASESYYYLNRILFGIEIRDIGSGFVVMRKAALDEIELHSDGFEIHTEIFVKLAKKGFKVIEIPLPYKHWPGGSFRFMRHGIKALIYTFKLWREV